jgi:hypothetical protein
MRRLSRFIRHTRVSVSRIIGMALAVPIIMLVAACDFPPTFGSEYKNSSANFIADRVLAEPPAAGADILIYPLDALASWDWAWRGQTGAGNTYQYMNAIDQGAGTGPGGSGNAWLLEAVNLAVNPAFAGGATTGWAASGAFVSVIAAIHGNALNVDNVTVHGFVHIDTGAFFDDISALLAHAYTISLNATGNNGLSGLRYLETEPALYTTTDLQPAGWSGAGPFSISLSGVTNATTRTLTFTHIEPHFQFDDISAIRTDVLPSKWSLVLRLGTTDTEPALVPGIYEFSLDVRRPPTHTFSTDAARGDSVDYASRFVTLRMTQTAGGVIQTVAVQSFNISSLPDTWNRIVLRMPSDSNFTFPESTTGGAIELSISPMNPAIPEAGAVLIANPSLQFYIDGY